MNWNQPTWQSLPNTGWQCPLCRIVHAPSVLSCRCQQQVGAGLSGTTAAVSQAKEKP